MFYVELETRGASPEKCQRMLARTLTALQIALQPDGGLWILIMIVVIHESGCPVSYGIVVCEYGETEAILNIPAPIGGHADVCMSISVTTDITPF
jgi:hypothetical protein